MSATLGQEFNKDLRGSMYLVDGFGGDNPASPSIVDHGMTDSDTELHESPLPPMFVDQQSGMSKKELNDKYQLSCIGERMRSAVIASDAPDLRKGVLLREIGVVDIRLQAELAEITGLPVPMFKDFWTAVTGSPPPSLKTFRGEILARRELLTSLLLRAGFKDVTPWTLKQRVHDWEASQRLYGAADADQIMQLLTRGIGELFAQFKAKAAEIPSLANYVGQLNPANCKLAVLGDMAFDAGSSYIGGNRPDGTPALASRIEWNAGRPSTEADIIYVGGHEATHTINASLMDLQRRDGKLGAEAARLTMQTPRCVNEEGLAQVIWEILYGGLEEIIRARGINFAITLVLDQLQDIARLTASLGWNIDFAHMPDEQRRLHIADIVENTLLQSSHIVHKYCGEKKKFWRMFPGGQMYSVAYWWGSQTYRWALSRSSAQKVLEVGCHTKGLVDIQAFEKLVSA